MKLNPNFSILMKLSHNSKLSILLQIRFEILNRLDFFGNFGIFSEPKDKRKVFLVFWLWKNSQISKKIQKDQKKLFDSQKFNEKKFSVPKFCQKRKIPEKFLPKKCEEKNFFNSLKRKKVQKNQKNKKAKNFCLLLKYIFLNFFVFLQ